jgi:DNA-binding transcriptional LysR family regulator
MQAMPLLLAFAERHPNLRPSITFTDRKVDIVEEGIDVAIRIGHLSDSGLTAARVGAVRRVICGSPAYFERHGIPETPADLKDHRIALSTGAWASPEWRFARDERVTIHPTLQSNTNAAGIAAALAGWGLTRVLHYQIGAALREGRLQVVLADREEPPLPIHVVYPQGRQAPAKVRTFVDLAVSRLRANPLLN